MKKTGRNDPCPCGSGKKYKQCCDGKIQSGMVGLNIPQKGSAPSQNELNQLVALFNAGHFFELERQAQLLVDQFPGSGLVWKVLGVSLQMQGKDGLPAMRKAAALLPDDTTAHFNLGNALRDLGLFDDAVTSYRRALVINPDYAEVHFNLGIALHGLGLLADEVASYQRTLKIKPDFAEAHSNQGNALHELGLLDDAVKSYRAALKLKPAYAEIHFNLGNAQRDLGILDDALESYRMALKFKPDYAEVYYNLGSVQRDIGLLDDAVESYHWALKFRPDYAEVRWQLALTRIPAVADTHEEIETCRERFPREIADLGEWFDSERAAHGYKAVGSFQPFYLAYQEKNNRGLLFQYGTLCAHLMRLWQCRQVFTFSPSVSSGLIRIGIVSAHIHKHSVWDAIVKGWFQHLDRDRIELHVFHVGSKEDNETIWAKSFATSFMQGKRILEKWVEAILEKNVDVLIFPEIGMDEMTVKLASLRLAPVQTASWGHPETTGLPTIDYYLSAEYLEPVEAQNNYTEKLICLPNLGCNYQASQVTISEPDFASLGIDADIPILLCPGVPFKYAPQHDHVLVAIAKELGRCQLVFFTHRLRGLSEKLHRRLEIAFAKANMDSKDYCKFIPWQEQSAFYGLMKRADVFLDTIGFSGFNTAMQAVECGLPIVTREGKFLRGRLASGILQRIGLTELITRTEEEYVNLAVNLVQDAAFRKDICERIEVSRTSLFDDVAPVRALEDFLIKIVNMTKAKV